MISLPGKNTTDPQLTKPKPIGTRPSIVKDPVAPKTPPTGSGTYRPPPGPQITQSTVNAAASGGGGGTSTAGTGSQDAGQDLTAESLTAMLAAIEAQYGLTAEQLMLEESDIGRQYRLIAMEAQRAGAQARDSLAAGAVDRGILRSGIYADQAGKLEATLAEQAAARQAEEQRRLAEIEAQRAALGAQQAADEAAAAQQAAALGLDLDLVKAASAGGV